MNNPIQIPSAINRLADDVSCDFSWQFSNVHQIGAPTVLINNAATYINSTILHSTDDETLTSFSVNLISHFRAFRAVHPYMLKSRKGHVITISSTLGFVSPGRAAVYAASKAGTVAFHESLTAECNDFRHPYITTTLVILGQIGTTLFKDIPTPSPFLAPVVSPHVVAQRLLQCITGREGGIISMPLYATLVPIFRALPSTLQQWIRGWSGIDRALSVVKGEVSNAE